MSPRISVIIPVYNTGRLLERCLQSVIDQSFTDWEAICVDDGSTDGETPALLDKIAARDPRIKVFHRRNGGVGAARNFALRQMSGEYVLFVDSDDFLHPQTMEICTALAERDGSDVVTFTYNKSYRTRLTLRQFFRLPEVSLPKFTRFGASDIKSEITDSIFDCATEYSHSGNPITIKHCQPWRCLYRARTISGIDFPQGIMYEDFPWWSKVLLRIRRASVTNLPLYYYYPNLRGYIHSASQQKRIESLKIAIPLAKEAYKDVSGRRKELWEANFLVPFEQKLAKKEKR